VASANNLPVLAAPLTMPRVGLWSADVVVDTDDVTKLQGRIDLELGDVHFKGKAYRVAAFQGRTELRMVAGAGGLDAQLPARFYREVPVSVPLGDILASCGETLSTTAETATLSRGLDTWTRSRGTGGTAIQQLSETVGFSWRALADGTIWVGTETWPELKADGELIDEFPADGRATFALDHALLKPGVTFRSRRVGGVVHRLTGSSFRTEVLFEPDGSLWSRLRGAFEAFVRALVAPTLYYGQFPAQVVSQGADGSLDLKPDDQRIPEMSGVPIRWGIPGFKAVVPAGTRVLVGFDGGDPRKRYAAVWDEGAITSVTFDNGVQAVARQGDLVQCGGIGTTVTLWPVTGSPAPPNAAVVAGVPHLISFDPILPTPLLAAPLYGAVSTGRQNFKA
jgi:hypothetical protein